jgi:peptide-methionine (S)-S-oxide reductase
VSPKASGVGKTAEVAKAKDARNVAGRGCRDGRRSDAPVPYLNGYPYGGRCPCMETVTRSSAIERYDDEAPDGEELETATFALGCFWGPDSEFGSLEGVYRTRVGYAGGTKKDPTYTNLGDHTETVRVGYAPDEVSYEDLLRTIFDSHDHTRRVRKRQYQNAVFVSDEEQREAVRRHLGSMGVSPETVETRIEAVDRFYNAEEYHQKYNLRSRDAVAGAFERAGYTDEEIRDSPAAAKLNGYAGGHGAPDALLVDED